MTDHALPRKRKFYRSVGLKHRISLRLPIPLCDACYRPVEWGMLCARSRNLGKKLMRLNSLRSMAASAAFGLGLAAAPASAIDIGEVVVLLDYGYVTPPGADRDPIYERDDVAADVVLETVRDGRMDVEFLDKTRMIVGPSSKVKMDRFVYDPNRQAGDVAVSMSRGVMRFVTGRLASPSYKIRTPTATMGVRGTDFVVSVDETGATTVSVIDGEVSMASEGGDEASVGAGSTGSTSGGSVSVATSIGLPAISTASFGLTESVTDGGDNEPEESGSSSSSGSL